MMTPAGFLLLLLSVPVILVQEVTYTSTQVCAPKGSSVDLKCSYTDPPGRNPLERPIWSRPDSPGGLVDLRTDWEYRGRVQYPNDGKDCTLRITDLRERDAAVYSFRSKTQSPGGSPAGPPGVTLSITDLQVKKIEPFYDQDSYKMKLSCQSPGCPGPDPGPGPPSYVWYQNGQKRSEDSSSVSLPYTWLDSFSCALKGFEEFPSPPECHSNDLLCNKVTYDARSVCAVKGSSVDISSRYINPHYSVTSKSWFRSDWSLEDLTEDTHYKGRVEVIDREEKRSEGSSTLRISDLRLSDSAEYRFTFTTDRPFKWGRSLTGTRLTVTDLQVKISSSSSSSKWVNLECISSCLPDGSSVVWFKNGEKISEGSSSMSLPYSRTDSVSCALKGFEEFPSPPKCLDGGDSCYKVTYDVRSVCAVKGSSVNISSRYYSYDSVTSKFWFRSDRSPEDLSEDTHYKGRVEVIDETGRSTLRISDLRLSDSADYRFTFTSEPFKWGRSLAGTRLTVTDLQVKISSSSSSSNGVNLECFSSCRLPDGSSFVWFKNGAVYEETKSSSLQVSSDLEGISCAVSGLEKFPSPPLYGPKSPSVSLSPSGALVEETSVTLSCSSDANPAASYTWYKEDQQFSEGSQLVFRSIQSSDSGLYHCLAENQLGTRKSEPVSVNVEYTRSQMMMINIIRLCVVPLIPVPLLLFHLWLRKKYSLSSISEAGGRVESVELHSRRPPPPQAEEEEGYELVE